MQHSRSTSREFAIILFCLLGVATINAWAHNNYRADWHAIRLTVDKALGRSGVMRDYQKMTLYELLDKHASDPSAVEAMKGVAIEAQILKEKAVDPEEAGASQAEKVGSTFKIHRVFSESGSDEGAHVISVEVNYPRSEGLEGNMWVLVQGQVRTLSAGPDKGKPVIDAVSVVEVAHNPEQKILTRQGEMEMPEEDHSGHSH